MALNVGSQGKAVADVQEALNKHGFDVGEVDGIFGPLTEAGVRAFQAAQGIAADGVVGDMTWKALGLRGSVPRPVRFD
jgi:peptidoglycan hydrolase-like protein with peptidoglycan-binding domain